MGKKKGEQHLHGNGAKIDPAKHVESLYETNMATLPNKNRDKNPQAAEEQVEYARKFVEENKK